MTEPLTLKHSFNSGDLLTLFPALKRQYKLTGRKFMIYQRLNLHVDYGHNDGHPITHNGKNVCMNWEMFLKLASLVNAQEYIAGFQTWQGEPVDVDIDLTRHHAQMPMPGGEIHYWPTLVFPQLIPDFSEAWLDVKAYVMDINIFGNYILINRTDRYRNPYISFFFLKPYEHLIRFVGTEKEYENFCAENNLNVGYFGAQNFLQLAAAINFSRFFIGNQSMCWHIADGLQVNRILEVCTAYPNTFPKGKNGYAYLTQNSLELYFHKLLKETNERKESEATA